MFVRYFAHVVYKLATEDAENLDLNGQKHAGRGRETEVWLGVT